MSADGAVQIVVEPLSLTVAEAAQVLRISERTLRKRMAEGLVPGVYLEGADQRIALEGLRAYVRSRVDLIERGRRPRQRKAS